MFDFNVDVKLTDENDPSSSQFINMTIGSVPPGATRLLGEWRGASIFVPSSGGEFEWDGRPGQGAAFVFDGPRQGRATTSWNWSGKFRPSTCTDVPIAGSRG